MRPQGLRTKIFLDSGDPRETREIKECLSFLDGQTTNPTLISKTPQIKERLARGEKFTKEEIFAFYRTVVTEISEMIPEGSVSIEVYADRNTSTEEMLVQGKEMFGWIPNAHVKYPTTARGLKAAGQSVSIGMRVNMTLVFCQEQAAAVYAATRGAKKGQVFLSPFVGRLDDRGENGMDLIANIIRMYQQGDGHVEVLTASARSLEHLLYAIALGSDIVTCPAKVLQEWAGKELNMPGSDYRYGAGTLRPILYQELDLGQPWDSYAFGHALTEQGIERFASDWNALIG